MLFHFQTFNSMDKDFILQILHTQKLKKSLSLAFFFFPTSLLALLLFLLIFNGLSIFSHPTPVLPQNPLNTVPKTKPVSSFPHSASAMYALNEEIPPTKRITHRNLQLFLPTFNSSSSQRSKWPRINRPILKFRKKTVQSKQFAARVREFFHGSSSSSSVSLVPRCEYRVFMTWISKLESFGQRELFTVESVFKSHPNACLLIISNSLDSESGARLLKPFVEKGFRVTAISPDFTYIFKKTPGEMWLRQLRKGDVNPGEVPIGQNLSNLLRLGLLYRFGGIYLDTDIIVMKSFAGLRNVIGAQTIDETRKWSRLNNAVMVFEKKHPLLFKFIEEFALTFDGSKWGHNGPYLVSRVVPRVVGRPGFNFSVLLPMAFYPVNWSRIGSLFHGPRGGGHAEWASRKLEQIRKESFAIHLWNRQSRNLKVEEGSVISQMMSNCCVFCNSSVPTL